MRAYYTARQLVQVYENDNFMQIALVNFNGNASARFNRVSQSQRLLISLKIKMRIIDTRNYTFQIANSNFIYSLRQISHLIFDIYHNV